MLTLEVYSLFLHYLLCVWTICRWNLNKIIWSDIYKILSLSIENRVYLKLFSTKLWHHLGRCFYSLLKAKLLIWRLPSFSITNITFGTTLLTRLKIASNLADLISIIRKIQIVPLRDRFSFKLPMVIIFLLSLAFVWNMESLQS